MGIDRSTVSKIDEEQTPFLEMTDLSCSDVKALSSLLLDGALVPVLLERVEAHIEQCDPCTELINELKFLLTQAKSLADRPMPKDSRTRLRAALKEQVGFQSPLLKDSKSNSRLS